MLPAALTGCGFELRRPPQLNFQSIALSGFAPRSPLAEELRRSLAQRVQVLDNTAQAQVVLQATTDLREKSVVASTSAAQVREFQLRVKFNFRATTPGGRELIDAPWPQVDPAALVRSEIDLVLQVNGKLRGSIRVAADASNAVIEDLARAAPEVARFGEGRPVKLVKVVPGRLVNVVV